MTNLTYEEKIKITIAIIITLLVGLLYLAIKSESEWQNWASVHCQVIRETSGTTTVGYTTAGDGGVITAYSAGKKTYKCDDGKEYVR
jgi:hypothetical protein